MATGTAGVSGTPIPVELTRFRARLDGANVILTWETASETNNAGFEVQRRTGDASSFETIEFVKGHGTTSAPRSYSFRDGTIPRSTSRIIYQLKQVDFDGASEYSSTVSVALGNPDRLALHGNFPNPFSEQTTVHYEIPTDQVVRLTVYDMLDREVRTLVDGNQAAGRKEVVFDASGLASGVYFLRPLAGDQTRTRKVTVAR